MIAGVLLACAVLWFVGAAAWYATSASKDGWSATPLPWMLVLTFTPALCVIYSIMLVVARRQSRFTVFDYCALSAALVAIVLGSLLVFMVLSSMRGMGI
jgi:hypothetical protein